MQVEDEAVPFDSVQFMTEQHLNILIKACGNAKIGTGSAEEFWLKKYGVKSLSAIPDNEFEFMLKGMRCDRYGNYIGKAG